MVLVAKGDHASAMRLEGLRVELYRGDYAVHPGVALMPDEAGLADLVLHCVKLYSNAETIPTMRPLVGDGTVLLSVQNGITGGHSLASRFGWDKVLQGATYIETSISAQGTIVSAARATLSESLEMQGVTETIRTVMEEIVTCGKANGVKFANGIVDAKLADAIAEADEFQSSLQSDFNRGGKLELDDILGAAVRLGRASGIPILVSTALVLMLQNFKGGASD